MSEVYWPIPDDKLYISIGTWYAQTFTPLWTHYCFRLRFNLAVWAPGAPCKISLQLLKPDDTPTGVDMASISYTHKDFLHFFGIHTFQPSIHLTHLVEGISYALVIGLDGINPLALMQIERKIPPSDYTRGKLIKSSNGGTTWDTTDLGDMLFGEFGEPPLKVTPYNPPIVHWGITEKSQNDFLTSSCIRVATTEPATLRAYVTEEKPVPLETWQPRRGSNVLCLANYTFKNWRTYDQLENTDSLYHTFLIKRLKEDEKYWITFIAESALLATVSAGPIFSYVHPEAPPFTTIRRPDAPGDKCTIAAGVPHACPDHYLNINEATPDGDTSYVAETFPYTYWATDLYNIPDLLPIDTAPIKQVHLTARFRYQGGFAYASGAKIAIKSGPYEYFSEDFSPLGTTYANYHWHLYENPQTGLPWTQAEVNNLQIGVRLHSYWGVGWATYSRCTQLFCKIIHQCEAYN